ncbi:unnamed protein product [Pieris macdunnoughi]|uniref:Methylated-DNA--protein-cysteine methyltransferase n=2 Tax=Pieris macdunnoughi TaxID=345717 RepID=A0A821X097_9NEOP|nr:unnamed protein product [Pieris macdunnoughi]
MEFPFNLNKISASSTKVYVATFDFEIGMIMAAGDDEFLYIVAFKDSKNVKDIFVKVAKELSCEFVNKKNKLLENFEVQLKDYFDGKLKNFSIPIKFFGTDFQKKVWDLLYKQDYGTTQTYGDLAKALGRSGSHARAIGAACGANGHIIVIPCHRIVASGSKGGFSSGGDRKEWLLHHEHKYN